MAEHYGVVNDSGIALTAATAKTLLQFLAGTGGSFKLLEALVSFNGVTATNEPVLVEILLQTTAGTGGAATIQQADQERSDSFATSAQKTFTAEPTASTILWSGYIHPQTGYPIVPIPLPGVLQIASAQRLGIRATAPNAVDAAITATIEE